MKVITRRKLSIVARLPFIGMVLMADVAIAASTPPQPAKYLNVKDPNGIMHAMNMGRVRKLSQLSKQNLPPAIKEYALAAFYRSSFDIELSNRSAADCYTTGLHEISKTIIPAIQCGELIAGNYLIYGKVGEWARAMQSLKTNVYKDLVHDFNYGNIILPFFGNRGYRIDFKNFFDFPVEEVYGNAVPNTVISRAYYKGHKGVDDSPTGNDSKSAYLRNRSNLDRRFYYLRLRINGHPVKAILDTGAGIFGAMTLSEATLLGLNVDPSDFYPLMNDGSPTHLGYAKRATFDARIAGSDRSHEVSLKNLVFRIGGYQVGDSDVILGLGFLLRLSPIMVEENGIVLNPAGFKCENSSVQVTLASLSYGFSHLAFEYPLDGVTRDILLDTGNTSYLMGTADSPDVSSSRVTSASGVTYVSKSASEQFYMQHVAFGPRQSPLTIRVYPYDRDSGFSYVMGVDGLRDFELFLDVHADRACLVPHT